MRRLLIAAAVLLAGPAQAVDYVQCQAIQRTMLQMELNLLRVKNLAGETMRNQAIRELCGSSPDTESIRDPRFKAWYECHNSAIVANEGRISAAKENSPSVIQPYNRLQRVTSDFTSKCY